MTQITELYDECSLIGFLVEGHANYSIPGRDIVCAAVSILTINTINSIAELSGADVEIKECIDGSTQYCIASESDAVAETLLRAARIGYKSIAEQYPDNVSYIERR